MSASRAGLQRADAVDSDSASALPRVICQNEASGFSFSPFSAITL
jgi:hypothetical protein